MKRIYAYLVLCLGLMPMSALAASVTFSDGVNYLIPNDEIFIGSIIGSTGAYPDNMFSVGFQDDFDGLGGGLSPAISFDPMGSNIDLFSIVWSEFPDAGGGIFDAITFDITGPADFLFPTSVFATAENAWLSLIWGSSSGPVSGIGRFDIFAANVPAGVGGGDPVAPVPLPAAGLLMAFGLASLAFFRSRRQLA